MNDSKRNGERESEWKSEKEKRGREDWMKNKVVERMLMKKGFMLRIYCWSLAHCLGTCCNKQCWSKQYEKWIIRHFF
jgi:hypothetical protein